MASNQQPNENLPPSSSFGGEPLGFIDELPESSSNQQQLQLQQQQQQQHQHQHQHNEDIVQVVYRSNPNGSLVGVESSLITAAPVTQPSGGYVDQAGNALPYTGEGQQQQMTEAGYNAAHQQQQQSSRATSTLPSVAEESSGSGPHISVCEEGNSSVFASGDSAVDLMGANSTAIGASGYVNLPLVGGGGEHQNEQQPQPYYPTSGTDPIYSRVNKPPRGASTGSFGGESNSDLPIGSDSPAASTTAQVVASTSAPYQTLAHSSSFGSQSITKHEIIDEQIKEEEEPAQVDEGDTLVNAEVHSTQQQQPEDELENDENLSHILFRQKGVAESGSFRNNFRKKLGISVSSSNAEADLTTHRQKFLQSREINTTGNYQIQNQESALDTLDSDVDLGSQQNLSGKFKRTHLVSFNVNQGRGYRNSIDIRNLPSYLTVKRASVVDLAKGAMSSLMHSFGSSGGGSGSGSGSHRRDSSPEDDEPIFEEAIAPTLSLGQRVALVKNNGSEFGTVGWIGQLPEVDDDWIVGVIFDNMIGNCDGAYNGQRYFYARENYAMFVPLSALTKTDNYIGRPETGTMLSRMSVSLKPGQLISIQRSSIRLQHCFLNAPHQRVGHDVRAVSNRLHCQCHNCGPCAHLTKQSRANVIPHFGAHHIHASTHQKKNSLAHAAVEILTHHHHHHFHEDEAHHEEEDYQFGDNAAHACNFVRYSCCQQSGQSGHEFASDCGLVRPELLDNLIHAPKAPHRRSRPRRKKQKQVAIAAATGGAVATTSGQQPQDSILTAEKRQAIESKHRSTSANVTGGGNFGTMVSASSYGATNTQTTGDTMTTNATSRSGGRSDGDEGSEESQSSGGSMSSGDSSSDELNEVNKVRWQQQHHHLPLSDRHLFSPYTSHHQPPHTSGGGYQTGQHTAAGYQQQQHHLDQLTNTNTTTTTTTYQQNLNMYNTMDSQVSYMDQARYIYQRDSSAMIPSHRFNVSEDSYEMDRDYDDFTNRGLVSSIRRCFGCMFGRNQSSSHSNRSGRRSQRHHRGHRGSGGGDRKRKKKRKTSLRDRMIEYRRKQSTFVPSTLAKPQEDFASHGLPMPPPGAPLMAMGSEHQVAPSGLSGLGQNQNNSDYSSQFSGGSSRSSSQGSDHPGDRGAGAGAGLVVMQQYNSAIEHNLLQAPLMNMMPDELQKSVPKPTLNYNDYTFDDRYGTSGGEKGKDTTDQLDERSQVASFNDSTDLGFCETCCPSHSSNDTLKSLVDRSINEEVAPVEPLVLENYGQNGGLGLSDEVYISPLSSTISTAAYSANGHHDHDGIDFAAELSEQVVPISSPTTTTASVVDGQEDVSNAFDQLNLNNAEDEEESNKNKSDGNISQ